METYTCDVCTEDCCDWWKLQEAKVIGQIHGKAAEVGQNWETEQNSQGLVERVIVTSWRDRVPRRWKRNRNVWIRLISVWWIINQTYWSIDVLAVCPVSLCLTFDPAHPPVRGGALWLPFPLSTDSTLWWHHSAPDPTWSPCDGWRTEVWAQTMSSVTRRFIKKDITTKKCISRFKICSASI